MRYDTSCIRKKRTLFTILCCIYARVIQRVLVAKLVERKRWWRSGEQVVIFSDTLPPCHSLIVDLSPILLNQPAILLSVLQLRLQSLYDILYIYLFSKLAPSYEIRFCNQAVNVIALFDQRPCWKNWPKKRPCLKKYWKAYHEPS